MLEELVRLGGTRFVDLEKGECGFDSQEFRDLLDFCAGLPPETDYFTSLEQGVLLSWERISNFYDPQQHRNVFGGETACPGLPNDWGMTGSRVELSDPVAMLKDCRHADGAWAFLRTLLLPRLDEDMTPHDAFWAGFPINKEDFDLVVRKSTTPTGDNRTYPDGRRVENTIGVFMWSLDGSDLEICTAPQSDYEQIMALYEAIEPHPPVDVDLLEIVIEVAGAYFAGDKTLDETVQLIQNRASLYVNEQK